MNRSKDLDNVAPDDLSVQSSIKSNNIVDQKPIEEPSYLNNKKEKSIEEKKFNQRVYDILGHSKNSFSSFLVRPKVLNFSEKISGEEIYLAVRPHWVNNLSWIFVSIIMLFVPFFLRYFTFLNFFPPQYQFSAILFWYLLTFIYAFEQFLSWYFNLFLITNKRVVDIDFNNLLSKHFAEADLSKIQDVSFSIKGVLATFFVFGDVLIQTASETNVIKFEKVANPKKIIQLLKELRDLKEKHKKGVFIHE